MITLNDIGPPYFDPPLSDVSIILGQSVTLSLPILKDPDPADTPSIKSIEFDPAI